ncbi:hypothetical protein [Streptomyces sp. NPDC002785]|uniref:hypothetical protein n=1 Tax=Streptomyces sp. NPDC002785 TaxID=3154543 RepID=UPI0033211DFD
MPTFEQKPNSSLTAASFAQLRLGAGTSSPAGKSVAGAAGIPVGASAVFGAAVSVIGDFPFAARCASTNGKTGAGHDKP